MYTATLSDQLWEAAAHARKNLKFVLNYQTDVVELNRLAAELRKTADTLDERAAAYAPRVSMLGVGGGHNLVHPQNAVPASQS